VEQEAVGVLLPGSLNLRADAEEIEQTAGPVDAHPEIDHDEIGIGAEIDGTAVDACLLGSLSARSARVHGQGD
jgi:hypothetical protein